MLDPTDPTCNHCKEKDFLEGSDDWTCRACGTSYPMPEFTLTFDHHDHIAPMEKSDNQVKRRRVEAFCKKLNVPDCDMGIITELLSDVSLHIKDRIIAAAIYFTTEISYHRIIAVLDGGSPELTKGCSDLRVAMLEVPKWANRATRNNKNTYIYTNLSPIIGKLHLEKDINIELRRKINKIEELLGSCVVSNQQLVRDVGVLWLALQMLATKPPSLKLVVAVSGLTYQSILTAERNVRKVLMNNKLV